MMSHCIYRFAALHCTAYRYGWKMDTFFLALGGWWGGEGGGDEGGDAVGEEEFLELGFLWVGFKFVVWVVW
jgi:hypothetical protein